MKKYWEIFNEIYFKKIFIRVDLEVMYLVNSYMDKFSEEMPLDEEQKELMKKTLSYFYSRNLDINEYKQMLTFFLPLEDLEKGLDLHDKIMESLSIGQKRKPIERILQSIKENEIGEEMIQYILSGKEVRTSLLLGIGYAYAANERKDWFKKEEREKIFSYYRRSFLSENFRISQKLFQTTNYDLLSTYQKIISQTESNDLIKLSVHITHRNGFETIENFIDSVKETYQELKELFVSIKDESCKGELVNA